MNRIVILDEELESQMRMYLALCSMYRVEIAEDEATLMRMIRRKKPKLIFLDANYSGFNNNGKSVSKTVEKIKRKYNELKIVTIWNNHEEATRGNSSSENADSVLFRPISEAEVVERVSGML